MTGIEKELADIRKLTRIALPESDSYLYRLGVAVYGFASVSSFMAEVICYMDPEQSRRDLEAKMGGPLAEAFKLALATIQHSEPQAFSAGELARDLFTALNNERSDIIHAYPITSPTRVQILHRRHHPAQNKKSTTSVSDKPPKYFEVTNEFLDNFIARLDQVNDNLYRVRAILRPDI